MYYDQGIRQQEITERLNIHQSKISRILKRASESNSVRISVATPAGFFPDIEEELKNRFQLKRAIVIDSDGDYLSRRDSCIKEHDPLAIQARLWQSWLAGQGGP